MKIAVISETSAADKNKDILQALENTDHSIVNCGMKFKGENPELQYIHTGFMAGLLLNSKRVDYVIGGCGTGQGFLNSVMQYPGVFCGHILTPLDAWLFTQINGGNCISLALNQGYGWAGDVNLDFLIQRLFSVQSGCGYPAQRQIPQGESRKKLADISTIAHRSFGEIISKLPDNIVNPVLRYPGFLDTLDITTIENSELKNALSDRI
ncbi:MULTISPECIES: RpiB/LacA/LacB family sugar-phosphate isomerase [unclassified Oceanispirochaeta]|uniref:RpiB/LacA/LacB family sugar-phosphate isomerase n=1 Tax=unclassified Oceanispirochaeta TaxID=2635722 RepID=UPI000E0942D4|nr:MULTISPECIES: RpiB/LacA/LacB family sugar-phosphate isomerase [unclassified Oceanispirochaeta]MBF9016986.1 RpiB/LacA/LacB family sugar-phosphate isomerase [Oceanispirochaeta sp. M2]NPD73349.1 ribose-5-phosphate isomerase [Oceanispirochaeta sp. M1]RDG31008.1 ribose-5-phosphate isomerase [Oceanispirochaeta sp. M1]